MLRKRKYNRRIIRRSKKQKIREEVLDFSQVGAGYDIVGMLEEAIEYDEKQMLDGQVHYPSVCLVVPSDVWDELK